MKLAIMQPYFFPYPGYFQLMKAVDYFVFFDDVNFIKKGWVNRNRIMSKQGPLLISLELKKASQNKKINEIELGNNGTTLLKKIAHTYSGAPNKELVLPLIEKCLTYDHNNLADFLINSLKELSLNLGLNTEFLISSKLKHNKSLTGQSKIIDICKHLGASTYINPEGGKELYNQEEFEKNNLTLKFHHYISRPYTQHFSDAPFASHLSIIDHLMFLSTHEIQHTLRSYDIRETSSP